MEKGEQVKGVKMMSSPCFASDLHDCTITAITYHGSESSQLTLTCNSCLRIKYVHNPPQSN